MNTGPETAAWAPAWLPWLVVPLQTYVLIVGLLVLAYIVRHFVFTFARLYARRRPSHQDAWRDQWPFVSVVVPMHNEARVLDGVMEALLKCEYPRERLEIIPVDDHSTDGTYQILERYAAGHPHIRPIYRRGGDRGKPGGLNDAIKFAQGEIMVVFDADYLPSTGIVQTIVQAFTDPEVAVVMGRVVPVNAGRNLLTRLTDLERSGGYQVDQQARYDLDLVPQYGGTCGGFRRDVIARLGGFDTRVLAEDTDLTFRVISAGWKVAYVNRAECYEESPEDWGVRFRQLRRWARGHTQVMLRRTIPFLRSRYPTPIQKLDGTLLLGVYIQPLLILIAMLCCLVLLLLGQLPLTTGLFLAFAIIAYNALGNLAPFFEVGAGNLLDGMRSRVLLLPWAIVAFVLYMFAGAQGSLWALRDLRSGGVAEWDKTVRYRGAGR